MNETAFVLIEKNDVTKEIVVRQQSFVFGSEEAKSAKDKQIEIWNVAARLGYNIICDGKIIYDYNERAKERAKERAIELERAKRELERAKKLKEVKQKDLTELTEEEIVLLAQSRVHGEHFRIGGRPAIGKATTFDEEYQKIKDAIEQKQSGNRTFH